MTNPDSNEASLGERLLKSGWYQGAIFLAPSIACLIHDVPIVNTAEQVTLKPRKLKAREKLILVTQDCDIKAKAEPFVEAMFCVVENNRNFIERISRNSARWFVVDPASGLLVEAKYRVQLSKEFLATLQPEPWPTSRERLGQFIRWLGRRYDRPAIPDEIVEVFQQPVERLLANLFDEQHEVMAAFNRVVHEMRVSVPIRDEVPYDLRLVFLTQVDALSQDEASAIDVVIDEILNIIDPAKVELDDVQIRTPRTMSIEEYFDTRPMFLEYYSYKGDEQIGAEPMAAG
jgi:hypothetical protein